MRHLDLWLSLLLLVLSASVSLTTYRVVTTRGSGGALWRAIPRGAAHFNLTRQGKCVGKVSSEITKDELLRFRLEMEMLASVLGQSNKVNLAGDSFFNPLGQLIRSRASLSFGEARFEVTSVDVHPITLNFRFVSKLGEYQQSAKLPGPVLLSEDVARGQYYFEYPQLQALSHKMPKQLETMHQRVEIKVAPVERVEQQCGSGNLNPVDLNNVLHELLAFAPGIREKFLPQGGQ